MEIKIEKRCDIIAGANRLCFMNSNTLLFIEAALSFSLKAGKAFNGDSKWQPQTLKLKNPWLVMHIHNLLGCDWPIPGSAMSEAVHGQLEWLDQLKRFEWCKDDRCDALDELDGLSALNALDVLDVLEWCSMRLMCERLIGLGIGPFMCWSKVRRQQRDWLEQCVWPKWCTEQSPTALEIVARPRLKLYSNNTLHPDPIALSLFLSQANKDILNDSHCFILQFFGSSLLPPNATE
jgi:hypothetical protein